MSVLLWAKGLFNFYIIFRISLVFPQHAVRCSVCYRIFNSKGSIYFHTLQFSRKNNNTFIAVNENCIVCFFPLTWCGIDDICRSIMFFICFYYIPMMIVCEMRKIKGWFCWNRQKIQYEWGNWEAKIITTN